MSEIIEIGDEVRTKVGKVARIESNGVLTHVVWEHNGKREIVYTRSLELVRKHNQPEVVVTTDKWAGVKKVKWCNCAYDVIADYQQWLGLMDSKNVVTLPFFVPKQNCTPYAPTVEVGSRVRDCDGGIATVRYISGSEACLERGESEIWVVRVADLTVIE